LRLVRANYPGVSASTKVKYNNTAGARRARARARVRARNASVFLASSGRFALALAYGSRSCASISASRCLGYSRRTQSVNVRLSPRAIVKFPGGNESPRRDNSCVRVDREGLGGREIGTGDFKLLLYLVYQSRDILCVIRAEFFTNFYSKWHNIWLLYKARNCKAVLIPFFTKHQTFSTFWISFFFFFSNRGSLYSI